MKGHIRERSSGHWAIVLDTRDPVTGKRKRRWHSFAGAKRQAQIECARLISEFRPALRLSRAGLLSDSSSTNGSTMSSRKSPHGRTNAMANRPHLSLPSLGTAR